MQDLLTFQKFEDADEAASMSKLLSGHGIINHIENEIGLLIVILLVKIIEIIFF